VPRTLRPAKVSRAHLSSWPALVLCSMPTIRHAAPGGTLRGAQRRRSLTRRERLLERGRLAARHGRRGQGSPAGKRGTPCTAGPTLCGTAPCRSRGRLPEPALATEFVQFVVRGAPNLALRQGESPAEGKRRGSGSGDAGKSGDLVGGSCRPGTKCRVRQSEADGKISVAFASVKPRPPGAAAGSARAGTPLGRRWRHVHACQVPGSYAA
jgi:hypothetical protein